MQIPAPLEFYINSSTPSSLSHTSQNCTTDSTTACKQSASHVHHGLLAPQPWVSFSQGTTHLYSVQSLTSPTRLSSLLPAQKIPYALSFISSHTAFTNQLTTFENTRDSNLFTPSSAGVISREEY